MASQTSNNKTVDTNFSATKLLTRLLSAAEAIPINYIRIWRLTPMANLLETKEVQAFLVGNLNGTWLITISINGRAKEVERRKIRIVREERGEVFRLWSQTHFVRTRFLQRENASKLFLVYFNMYTSNFPSNNMFTLHQ